MPRKAAVSPGLDDIAKIAGFEPENDAKISVEPMQNTECNISVKSEKSAEKQTKTRKSAAKKVEAGAAVDETQETKPRRSGTKKADPGILDDTAQDEPQQTEPKKRRSYYRQKVPNEVVRKEAALAYIEKKTAPKRSNKANGHFPNSDEAIRVEPGDNARYVMFGMAIYNMDPIDICNTDDVERRIQEYFKLCIDADMKPGVANLAMALGIDRHRLLELVNGADGRMNVPHEVATSIKKAHAYMGSYWEQIMQNGKINPASGIFLGKNNFGYKDQTEHVLTPNTKLTDTVSPLEMQRRIESIPDD